MPPLLTAAGPESSQLTRAKRALQILASRVGCWPLVPRGKLGWSAIEQPILLCLSPTAMNVLVKTHQILAEGGTSYKQHALSSPAPIHDTTWS